MDAVEWNTASKAYIEGELRDGGLAMPDGYWETARLPGAARRLTRVEAERDGAFEAVSMTAFSDRIPGGTVSNAPLGQRWARWPTLQQGVTHRLRVAVPETLSGVGSLTMVFQGTAGPGR